MILPGNLKSLVKIKHEIVVAGVLDKIELWPKDVYDANMKAILEGKDPDCNMQAMSEEAFALLAEEDIFNEP